MRHFSMPELRPAGVGSATGVVTVLRRALMVGGGLLFTVGVLEMLWRDSPPTAVAVTWLGAAAGSIGLVLGQGFFPRGFRDSSFDSRITCLFVNGILTTLWGGVALFCAEVERWAGMPRSAAAVLTVREQAAAPDLGILPSVGQGLLVAGVAATVTSLIIGSLSHRTESSEEADR